VAYAVVLGLTVLLYFYTFHCTWVTSEAYSSPSIVLAARSTDGTLLLPISHSNPHVLRLIMSLI
jgi:dolichyl-diphosphooligosaccharide--protein glycosyltransferase